MLTSGSGPQESFLHGEVHTQAVKVKVAQSCPTLCHPVDYTVHGILLARILEWVAFPFSGAGNGTHTPVLLPGKSHGREETGRLLSMGSQSVGDS